MQPILSAPGSFASEHNIKTVFSTEGNLPLKMLKMCNKYTFEKYDFLVPKDFSLPFKCVSPNAKYRNYMLYSLLNEDQRAVVKTILTTVDEIHFAKRKPCTTHVSSAVKNIFVLDAKAGCGKTYTLLILLLLLKNMTFELVFSEPINSLLWSLQFADSVIEFKTHASLIMKLAQLDFSDFNSLPKNFTIEELTYFFKIVCATGKGPRLPFVYIVDEYTMMKPINIALLLSYAKHNKGLIIFAGDCKQLKPIGQCKYYNSHNIDLILPFSTLLTLTRQVRCTDHKYNEKLDRIRELCDNSNRLSIHFYYTLYELFYENFHLPEQYSGNTLHLATRHVDLMKKLHRTLDYLESQNIRYYVSPYASRDVMSEVSRATGGKFPLVLYLIVGYLYTYTYFDTTKKRQNSMMVRLLRFVNAENVLVQCLITQKIIPVTVRRLNATNFTANHYEALVEYFSKIHVGESVELYGFPLIYSNISTLHSIQGKSISSQLTIECNLNRSTPNGVYVAISRIMESSSLGRLFVLPAVEGSLKMTELLNDGFYYIISNSLYERIEDYMESLKKKKQPLPSTSALLSHIMTMSPFKERIHQDDCNAIHNVSYKIRKTAFITVSNKEGGSNITKTSNNNTDDNQNKLMKMIRDISTVNVQTLSTTYNTEKFWSNFSTKSLKKMTQHLTHSFPASVVEEGSIDDNEKITRDSSLSSPVKRPKISFSRRS